MKTSQTVRTHSKFRLLSESAVTILKRKKKLYMEMIAEQLMYSLIAVVND